MTNEPPPAYWPQFDVLVAELRCCDQSALADLLVDAVRAGATSGEILDGVGCALREGQASRSHLNAAGQSAWDAVLADVRRAYPGSKFGHWLGRLHGGSGILAKLAGRFGK